MLVRNFFNLNTERKNVRILFLSVIGMMVILLYALAPQGSPVYHFKKKQTLTSSLTHEYTKILSEFLEDSQDEDIGNQFTQDFNVKSYQDLGDIFSRSEDILSEDNDPHSLTVPRLYLVALPKDFKQASINSKKKLFVKSLLPLILRANENILTERRKLLNLMSQHQAGLKLNTNQRTWLTEITVKYRLKKLCFKELLKRIDVIPPSLALGQAIVETGWGSSYSALQKNATFGMRTTERPLVYDSLMESVENYMGTINRHPAYEKMRVIRHALRTKNQNLCSMKLVQGLVNYSTRKEAYVREVADLISRHGLKKYDSANLMNKI